MKSKFKKIFLALLLAVFLPVITVLTGCGATPSGTLTGILFDTLKYDEETGMPIFEVDKDITIDLAENIKIYPSSASGYKIYFDPVDKGTAENSSRFTFKDGKVTVNSKDFEEVRYKVRVGKYSDTCIIRLKEYPVQIWTDETSIVASAYDVVPINVRAKFVSSGGVETFKNITENDFDFLVETNDETIVQVPNENRLKICPVRNGKSTAEVTVSILNGQGEKTGLSFKITINVIQNISTSFVSVSGVETFIEDGDTANLEFNELEIEGDSGKVDLKIYPVNVGDLLVEDEFDYTIYLSNKKYAKVSGDGKYILIDNLVENNHELMVTIIVSDLSMGDNSTFAIDFKLVIKR